MRVHVRVKETSVKEEIKGKPKETERERVQVFEGIVIGLRGTGARATMTVRKVSFGQGVERIFPLHAKTIEKIEVVKQAQVRRAKLYYLRDLKGKAGRMKEKRTTPERQAAARGASTELGAQVVIGARWNGSARPRRGRKPLVHHGRGAALHLALRGGGPRGRARRPWPAWTRSGRGALCGPVVACVVILGDGFDTEGLDDSKRLTARQREALAARIREKARGVLAWASPSPREIDRLNILRATYLAMQRAVAGAGRRARPASWWTPWRCPAWPCRQQADRQGRRLSASPSPPPRSWRRSSGTR